jgi:antitoxin component YwqK of YwqJK toxin-antitoxin module
MMACLFFQACNSADKTILSKKSTVIDTVAINNSRVINDSNSINNTIPDMVIHSKDPFLQMHQDTLFFQDKKFSGTIFDTYSNGDTAMTGHFLNGLEQGVFKKWYANKQLAESRSFEAGKKMGKHIGFWEDGKPKFEFYFTKGEHDGIANEWYSNGQAYKAFHYTMGYENGSQKIWWENGVIRANYVVKQGRRYGLIGLKLCMTPQDSLDYKFN